MLMRHIISTLLSCLAVMSCTDLSLMRTPETERDLGIAAFASCYSICTERTPGNIWNLTFTYGEGSASRDVTIKATKPAGSSFTVDLESAGDEFVAGYSEKTGTDYELLPSSFYRFSGGNYIDVASGSQESGPNTLTVYARNLLGNVLEPGRYLLPIVASSLTEELADTTLIVDITVREKWSDPDGYELYTGDDMFTVFYVNTTQFDPRLANDMILYDYLEWEDKSSFKGLGNIVNLRTASVEYDEVIGSVSVKPTPDLKYVLEHYSERVLPVQESGRKVCICIEGGGKGIGFCNFSDAQIAEFTNSVKRLVDTYGLDGINLWDRNTGYDKAAENGLPEMNTTSYPKLIKALKEALGDGKLLTLTDYEEPTEYFHDVEAMGGIEPGRYLDYAWSGYCNGDEPVQIVDPWHQGEPNVSALHPRKPIAGLDASKYGCVHATWYPGSASVDVTNVNAITGWINSGFNPNGISVYYDIRSIIQDNFESGSWNPAYILSRWLGNNRLSIETSRLTNKPGFPGYNNTGYNKWVKYW